MERTHRTVMKEEVIELLGVFEGGTYLDATFGEGGHSEAILAAGGRVIGLDRDRDAIAAYQAGGTFKSDSRLTLVHGQMSEAAKVIAGGDWDGIIADLGVSTRQILSTERGFSFRGEGPLDMRMDPSGDRGLKEVLEGISERDLADALYYYGEIRSSRRIASQIVADFNKGLLTNTAQLAAMMPGRHGDRHPATQLFMALRMLVNDELGEIDQGFPSLFERLKTGGKFCAITFHSIEDRLVKRIFKKLAGQCGCDAEPCQCPRVERAKILSKKPILPSDREQYDNPRSRSAKLRCIEKVPTTT